MRNYFLPALFLAALTLAAPAADAGTVSMYFTALPTAHMNAQDNSSAADATYNGYVNTTIAGFPAQQVICDDIATDTMVPYTYTYTAVRFGWPGWESAVKFTSPSGYSITNTGGDFTNFGVTVDAGATETLTQTQAYEIAAVLLANFDESGPNPTAVQITDVQYALWYIFNNRLPVNGTNQSLNPNSLNDLFTAYAFVASTSQSNQAKVAADASKLVIYDDVPRTAAQEFLGLNTVVPTPEPAAWMMVGGCGFLYAVGRLAWRRKVRE